VKARRRPPVEAPPREPDAERSFRGTIVFIALAHVALVLVLFALGRLNKLPKADQIMWLDEGVSGTPGSSSEGGAPEPAVEERRVLESRPEPVVEAPPPPKPVELPAPSEIVLPHATPPPATPPPTPKPTPKATPKPTPVATPKPATPKPVTPKPVTPKPTPKATPNSTPAVSPTPKPATSPKASPAKPAADSSPKAAASPGTSTSSKAGSSPKSNATGKGGAGDATTAGKGTGAKGTGGTGIAGIGKGAGTSGNGPGASGGASQFGWYYTMIHERFNGEWQQPTSIVRSSQKFVTKLKIRVAKDGHILKREIVNSSGNTIMDASVLEAAQRVNQIDALPAGLGGEYFDVAIDFALDQGE
jgi:TonB family protein